MGNGSRPNRSGADIFFGISSSSVMSRATFFLFSCALRLEVFCFTRNTANESCPRSVTAAETGVQQPVS